MFVNDNETTIDTSETVSSITLSEEKNTIETTADKTDLPPQNGSTVAKSNDVAPTSASDDDDTLSYFSKLAEEE